MQHELKKLLKYIIDENRHYKDLHVIRFYSSYVLISDGKAIKATEPYMAYCPLANFLYKSVRRPKDKDALKEAIIRSVNEKMSRFGHFTKRRELRRSDIAIPYGASEILMYAMRRGLIDAAVVVCDGAGTVIADDPEVVQGIGARMNGLFFTTPIPEIMDELKKAGCHVISRTARIDQIEGVKKAAGLGYKNIAVTINGLMDVRLNRLKEIERDNKVSVTSLTVCTTGATEKRVRNIEKYADIVWSCASEEVRALIGKKAIMQVSRKIPVFVLTQKGLVLISGYSSDPQLIKDLDPKKQYLIAKSFKGRKVRMGDFETSLNSARLPVRSNREPRLL